jgi:uncharacterized membrane protein
MDFTLVRVLVSFIIAVTLAYHGYRKKSLSIDGCLAAFLVGFSSIGVSYRFGVLLLAFYYSSTKLTKYKQEQKSKLEEDFVAAGQRNWKQVFGSSILAIFVAAFYFVLFGEDKNAYFGINNHDQTIQVYGWEVGKSWLNAQLHCLYLAHFAVANGDTWASEVGMLSKPQPRLITSLWMKVVPPGTNGGMSLLGTLASAAGGAFIGFVYYLLSFCYPTLGVSTVDRIHQTHLMMIVYGCLCGLLGSIIDSLLGATLQVSYFCTEKKKIVKDYDPKKSPSSTIKHISGIDILSNEAVNVFSIAITMILSWWLAPMILTSPS